MARIPQTSLFDWEDDIEILGDLERLCSKCTPVERVNGTVGWIPHSALRTTASGQARMRLRCSLAFVVMLAMPLGRVREKR